MKGTVSFGSLRMTFNGTYQDRTGEYFFELDMDIDKLADGTTITNITEYIDTLMIKYSINNESKVNIHHLFKIFLQSRGYNMNGSNVNGSNVNGSNVNGIPKRKRDSRSFGMHNIRDIKKRNIFVDFKQVLQLHVGRDKQWVGF